MLNSSGDRIEPCGVPRLGIGINVDQVELTPIVAVRFVRKEFM